MSRFTKLKASGTDRVGFPTPRSGVMEAMLAGADRRPMPQGKPTMTANANLDALTSLSGATPPAVRHKKGLSPFAVFALSSFGALAGLVLMLNVSSYGSVGRYQFTTRSNGSTVLRLDTTTGEMSLCYGFGLSRPKGLPWGHDTQPYKALQHSQAGQQGGDK